MSELCWTLLGARDPATGTWRVRFEHAVVGGQARVEADWSWTLAREESQRDVAGFFHTHPPGSGASPSDRDVRTMQAWCSALGKPLLCLIAEDGNEGAPSAYLFMNDEDNGASVGSPQEGTEGGFTVREQ
jgi:proteasome lid subunit RPN8/RPN11